MSTRCLPLVRLALAFVVAAVLGFAAAPAKAERVQQVVSPGGITAWLIESHALPLIRMSFSFRGGASQDPPDKPGVANFADWMFNEGAGQMNTADYFRAKKLLGASESRTVTDERQVISFSMLSEKRDASFELLRQLLVEPRFDDDAMVRARASITSSLEALKRNPASNVGHSLFELLYPGHPYGKQRRGTPESVKSITRQDLEDYRRKTFARDNLMIAVVGDIDAATLGVQLDKVFGGLPAHAQLVPMPAAHSQPSQEKRISDEARQTTVVFGYVIDTPLKTEDMPGVQILNHIMSGGILTSRLEKEVRVKRGLVYTINFQVSRSPDSQYASGAFGAEPSSAEAAYALAREQIRKLAEEGPSSEEVRNAKTYLQGAYVVGLSNSTGLAGELLDLQRFGYGLDAIDSYSSHIEAVTMEQLRELAKRIFKPDAMSYVMVGPFGQTNPPSAPSNTAAK